MRLKTSSLQLGYIAEDDFQVTWGGGPDTCATVHESKGQFVGRSFSHTGPRNWTGVIKLCSKHLYTLRQVTGWNFDCQLYKSSGITAMSCLPCLDYVARASWMTGRYSTNWVTSVALSSFGFSSLKSIYRSHFSSWRIHSQHCSSSGLSVTFSSPWPLSSRNNLKDSLCWLGPD